MEEAENRSEEELKRAYLARLQLRATLKKIMTKEAYERLERVKMASPDLYSKAVQAVIYAFQSTGSRIDEGTLLSILKRLKPKKREPTIKVLHK